MAELQGLVWFPGVAQPISGSYTLSHGITPGIATITMQPQAGFVAEGGILRFTFGSVDLIFPDCKVDMASLKYDSQGFLVSLSILDRRWKWSFGGAVANVGISGSYNTRREDGRIYPNRLATARTLAELCLIAMGETNYNVSLVPENVFPEVEWTNELPAQALANIADECGCRVVLRLDNTVVLYPVGFGLALPENELVEADSLTINPPERPDSLAYVCGPTRFQIEILLRAVGLDEDGQIKKIDDLSYTPSYGWAKTDRQSFSDVAASLGTTDPEKRRKEFLRTLARQTVWRWYQIAIELKDEDNNNVPYEIDVPQFGRVTKLKQILLLDEQVELMQDIDGLFRAKPAQVIGTFADMRLGMADTKPGTVYWRGFSIDAERGLVIFNDQIVRIADGDYYEANITLRTAINVRDEATWAWSRYVRPLSFGTLYGTGAKLYRHEESFLAVLQSYDENGNPTTLTTNQAALDVEADQYLAAALNEFQTTFPQDITYAGLWPISPDGAIQQVQWEVSSDRTCFTRASRNTEFSNTVPMHRTRRFFEQIRNNRTLEMQKRVNGLAREIAFKPPRPD